MKFEGKFKTTNSNSGAIKSNGLGMKAAGVDLLVHKIECFKKKTIWEILPKQKLLQCDDNIKMGLLKKTSDCIGWYEQNKSKLNNYIGSGGLNFFHIACSIGKWGTCQAFM
jgi:hypothetical protein